MTEAAYQEARKLMQRANYLRGMITTTKGEVVKWTRIEDANINNMQPGKADGANKRVKKAIKRLEELRMEFAALQFPDPNTEIEKRCPSCEASMDQCICCD